MKNNEGGNGLNLRIQDHDKPGQLEKIEDFEQLYGRRNWLIKNRRALRRKGISKLELLFPHPKGCFFFLYMLFIILFRFPSEKK